MESLMDMMHCSINRAISSASSDRAIPKIQNTMGLPSSGPRNTESGASVDNNKRVKDKINKEGLWV